MSSLFLSCALPPWGVEPPPYTQRLVGAAEEGQLLAVEGCRGPRENVLQRRTNAENMIATSQDPLQPLDGFW